MHPLFTLQIAVGHRPAEGDGGLRDTGFFIVAPVQQFDTVLVFIGPVDIHPQEHFGPIIRVDASIARMNAEDGSVAIERTA